MCNLATIYIYSAHSHVLWLKIDICNPDATLLHKKCFARMLIEREDKFTRNNRCLMNTTIYNFPLMTTGINLWMDVHYCATSESSKINLKSSFEKQIHPQSRHFLSDEVVCECNFIVAKNIVYTFPLWLCEKMHADVVSSLTCLPTTIAMFNYTSFVIYQVLLKQLDVSQITMGVLE